MRNLIKTFKNIVDKPVFTKKVKLDGKVAVITGGNSGIGKETAIDLAKRGGRVYIACRDIERSKYDLEEIKGRSKATKVHLMQLDLASMKSIRQFSKQFHEREDNLHILINNAGVMACPHSFTEDGFEMHFGVNHLGHFLLTNLLLDLLKTSAHSRIVVVSSEAHRLCDINKDDLMSEHSYNKFKAYAQSKLANILFARELGRRLYGTGVTVNSCHPGIVHTHLGRHMESSFRSIYRRILKPLYKTPFQGAQTQIKLAVDPDLKNVTGKYFSDCEEISPSRQAQDDETASWLWAHSAALINHKF